MVNTYKLSNELITATFNTKGAELTSLILKSTGCEYLWKGKSNIWERQNPVLFPIIASLENDSYIEDGNSYQMFIHGFALNQRFALVKEKADEIVFRLTENAQTLAIYPFRFVLDVTYRISLYNLMVEYSIYNPSSTPLKCFVGGHPTFACPLIPETGFSDYYLQFEKPENIKRLQMEGPYLSGKETPLLDDKDRIPLEKSLFTENAIVTEKFSSKWIEYRSDKYFHGIRLNFGNCPQLGIFSYAGTLTDAYICIEPWHGLPARKGKEKTLDDKPGLICIAEKQQFTAEYSIEVF